jgi:hypothetical protein
MKTKTVIRCTNCYHPFDTFTVLNDTKPIKPGTINVCANCGNVTKFDNEMQIVTMTGDDIFQLVHDHPEIYQSIVHAVTLIMERVKLN